MDEQEKKQLTESIEKRYKNRPNFRKLFERAQRVIYRKDILQPQQREFRDVYKKSEIARKSLDRMLESEAKTKQAELDAIYRQKPKGVVTYEEKILRDIHAERPNMVSEEDIIRWQ